jgi:hypothetical protein
VSEEIDRNLNIALHHRSKGNDRPQGRCLTTTRSSESVLDQVDMLIFTLEPFFKRQKRTPGRLSQILIVVFPVLSVVSYRAITGRQHNIPCHGYGDLSLETGPDVPKHKVYGPRDPDLRVQ